MNPFQRDRGAARLLMLLLVAMVPLTRVSAQSSPDDAACQPPAPPGSVRTSVMRLAPANERGERLRAVLQFRSTSGEPLRELLVFAYQANAEGAYVPAHGATGCLRFHGALHAWARPDSNGLVTIHTIRPGPYPRSTEPAHMHVVVQFPGRRGFYLNDLLFDDDPRLTPDVRAAQQAPGGSGIVRATRDRAGVWSVVRQVELQRPTR